MSVHLNSGSHGENSKYRMTKQTRCTVHAAIDQRLSESLFTQEDLDMIRKTDYDNFSLNIISPYSKPFYPKEANAVIDGLCFSSDGTCPPLKKVEVITFVMTIMNADLFDDWLEDSIIPYNLSLKDFQKPFTQDYEGEDGEGFDGIFTEGP